MTAAVRLATADEIANSVSVAEIAKQYKTTVRMVYKLACLHQWRRIRKGRSIYYDVVEVARALGE